MLIRYKKQQTVLSQPSVTPKHGSESAKYQFFVILFSFCNAKFWSSTINCMLSKVNLWLLSKHRMFSLSYCIQNQHQNLGQFSAWSIVETALLFTTVTGSFNVHPYSRSVNMIMVNFAWQLENIFFNTYIPFCLDCIMGSGTECWSNLVYSYMRCTEHLQFTIHLSNK